MMDKILALLALLALGAFLGVLVLRVPEVDLSIVVIVVMLLAAIDFGLALFRRPRRPPPRSD